MFGHPDTKLARRWPHLVIAAVLLAVGSLTFRIPVQGAAGAAPYSTTGPQVTITGHPPQPG